MYGCFSVNAFAELVRRQLSADVRALPARARQRLTGETALAHCRNVSDLRALAKRRVPRAVFDYVDGAALDEVTARSNEDDFARIALSPKMLAGVTDVDLATTVLRRTVAVPLLGAPTGLTGLVHHRGEVGIARAVHDAGSIYVQSSLSSYSIEELAAAAPGPTWFQLYVWRDRGLVKELLERAAAVGHEAVVLTVDVPHAGARE